MASIRDRIRAARAPSAVARIDPAELDPVWLAKHLDSVEAKITLRVADLPPISGGDGAGVDAPPDMRRRSQDDYRDEAWRLDRQLDPFDANGSVRHIPRIEPHVAPLPPLWDSVARDQAVAMREAGESYARIAAHFAGYRGAPTKLAHYRTLVLRHRANRVHF